MKVHHDTRWDLPLPDLDDTFAYMRAVEVAMIDRLEADDIGPEDWNWDVTNSGGSNLAPGIYLYNIKFPAGSTSGKLMVIR